MVGRKMAIRIDLTSCAPRKKGRSSFLSPKARKPRPKPVMKVFALAVLAKKCTQKSKIGAETHFSNQAHAWIVTELFTI
jgi:hypothetical protein